MYPHYYKPQKPKTKWQRKLEQLNPNALTAITLIAVGTYFIIAIIL